MSSASSAVTYTSVYIDSKPGRVFWEPTRSYQTEPHDLDFVLEPIYPEYIPLEDEHILPAEEKPLPHVVSCTAKSPGYVAESNLEEDPEEYEDDKTEDGPVDYSIEGGDDGDDDDDDDDDSSGDDADDEDEEEEEEEHLASADSAIVIPTEELVSPPEEIEHAVISFPLEAEVERLLAMPTPSPSPLASLLPPSAGERLARYTAPAALPSPPLPPPLHMLSPGNSAKSMTIDNDGNLKIRPSVTVEEHQQVQREEKARTILLSALPDEHMGDFCHMIDAWDIWNAIKARFVGNEGLDKGYDKMQKIPTQMNTLKIKLEPEDVNMKFLRGLPPSRSGITLILKTKGGLKYISFDDLYNKLKFLEINTKGYLSSSSTLSSTAFVSTTGSSQGNLSYQESRNDGHTTTLSISLGSSSSNGSLKSKCSVVDDVIYSFFANHEIDQHLVYEDLDQMNTEEFEEYDVKHQMTMLSITKYKSKEAGKDISNLKAMVVVDDADSEGEVVSADNAIPADVFVSAGDVAAAVIKCHQTNQLAYEEKIRVLSYELEEKSNILEYRHKLIDQAAQEKQDLMTKLDNEIVNQAKWNNNGKNLYKLIDISMSVRTKRGLGLDKYIGEGKLGIDDSKFSIFHTNNDKLEGQPIYNRFALVDHMKAIPPPLTGNYMPPFNIPDIDESHMVYRKKATDSSKIKTNDDSISHSNNSVLFDFSDSVSAPVSESRDTIVIDCDRQEDFPSVCSIETDVKSSKTLYCDLHEQRFAKRNAEGKGILGRRTTGKPINPNRPKPVSAGQQNPVFAGQPNPDFAGQPNPVFAGDATLTCNSIPLFVSPGDGILGLRPLNIQPKSTYFHSFTHNNHQIIFLITHNLLYSLYMTGGLNGKTAVKPSAGSYSLKFPLPDPSMVILSIPRKHNLYAFNLNELAPKGPLTCLIAKALHNESTLWHRRLGHVNFKNMNKLVKGNLVKGLLSKVFQNNHTCVACNKGKQHKASYKAIPSISLITEPLHLLYTDLFGPTSVRSINNKYYCLVTIDEYTRFSLVYFLEHKSETFLILKFFITLMENQFNHKVKVIRCDNGTEFKNANLIEFYGSKGIRWDYRNARTLQQNGVAERKNRTLIVAARTMLVVSLLPTIFWTEAVATACNVLNRVLVTKPHDKTPYKLLTGDKPSISYLKPFGCHVTILNTSDPLGKFDKKSDKGYIVRYSISSKAYRVYNLVSRKIEETMNLKFLKNKPFVAGTGSQEDDSDSDDEPDVLIIQSTPTSVVPIVDEATTQNDGTEEADYLRLAFPSLNLILGVGSASIISFISAGSTPSVSAGSTPPIPTGSAGRPVSAGRPSGSADRTPIFDCPKSGIFTSSSYDEEFSGLDANNLERSLDVSSTITKRIYNIHPTSQLLGDINSPVQTRRQALADPDWVEAMQAEMQQFRNQKEEGIDYTDVFALVARIKAIRLFLAFASFMGFMVYQMDVKSAFLYGKITEEVYVTQPRGFEDPDHPQKVYKVVKALYGLHQAPRASYARLSTFLLKNGYRRGTIDKTLFIKKDSKDIMLVQVYVDDIIFGTTRKDWCEEFETLMQSKFKISSMGPLTFFLGLQVNQRPDGIFIYQEKYVADILRKFDLANSKLASTPIEPQKIREKNVPDEPISVHLYRSMIGCLMYLTATRPDFMFAVCAAARHQVTPKTSKLLSVKRIFKYLTTYPKLGLWYPQDSLFDLEAFSDSDYAGANRDKKSTTGGF
uniref:Integrase catalytic domain-containing protein n=1 Tax=Tanacetum cinerariifolium TaxID=118510 RepID=A0A6L2M5X3_TANCI|nr:hypothetical protein [Tanacetum cinerariifolium]